MAVRARVKSQIDNFFAQFRLRKYPKGQILILNGDKAEHVFKLVKGRVKQYDVTYRGDEVILNTYMPSDLFPMSLAISKADSPYIYEAETVVEVRQAPASDTIKFIKSHSKPLHDLLVRAYRDTDDLLGRMVHLMTSSARGRVMFEIILECRRFGKIGAGRDCTFPISEKGLGARTGLSRETVSREISKLTREKFILLKAGYLTIYNVDAFEKKLGKVI